MSGSGRKSQYRKSVTDEYLNGFPLPEDRDVVAMVKSSRGTNIFEIQMGGGSTELAMMPTKFKKLIWIKRGDYVIVSASADGSSISAAPSAAADTFKVNFLIKHILTKPQIKHIQQAGVWDDRFDITIADEKPAAASGGYGQDLMMDSEEDEEEDYEDEEEEELVDKMGNTIPKRPAAALEPEL